MAMFVWVGTGTAVVASRAQFSGEPKVSFPAMIHLPIAIAFGFGITVLAGNLGAYSGGHVNPPVTLPLMITCHCEVLDGSVYILCQALGAIVGSLLVSVCTSHASYVPPANLDTETLQPGWKEGDIIDAIGYPPFALGADHVHQPLMLSSSSFSVHLS
eukprot:CCRYP_012822-RA/>CCRYP_012822-RA protein AED:0.19 eAED:0.28 QI:0/-1/0/1/-1/1/1/0/157